MRQLDFCKPAFKAALSRGSLQRAQTNTFLGLAHRARFERKQLFFCFLFKAWLILEVVGTRACHLNVPNIAFYRKPSPFRGECAVSKVRTSVVAQRRLVKRRVQRYRNFALHPQGWQPPSLRGGAQIVYPSVM